MTYYVKSDLTMPLLSSLYPIKSSHASPRVFILFIIFSVEMFCQMFMLHKKVHGSCLISEIFRSKKFIGPTQ